MTLDKKEFEKPAEHNYEGQFTYVGCPPNRIYGSLNKTASIPYAFYWHYEAPDVAYGYVVANRQDHAFNKAFRQNDAILQRLTRVIWLWSRIRQYQAGTKAS